MSKKLELKVLRIILIVLFLLMLTYAVVTILQFAHMQELLEKITFDKTKTDYALFTTQYTKPYII